MAEIETWHPLAGTFNTDVENTGGTVSSGQYTIEAPAAPNQPPVANAYSFSVLTDGTTDEDVASYASDPEGGAITLTAVTASVGTATVEGGLMRYVAPSTAQNVIGTYTVTDPDGGETTGTWSASVLTSSGTAPTVDPVTVEAGRNYLWTPAWGVGAQSLEVISQPSGTDNVGVDGLTLMMQLVLDLSARTKTFDVRVTYQDLSSADVTLQYTTTASDVPMTWAIGNVYALNTDADGITVPEPAETHRSVYISGSGSAWTAAAIATAEGLNEGDIDADWLYGQNFYGGSEAEPLAEGPGMDLADRSRYNLNDGANNYANPTGSVWVVLENGYTYSEAKLPSFVQGFSPLHPTGIKTFGTGTRAKTTSTQVMQNPSSNNIFHVGVDVRGVSMSQIPSPYAVNNLWDDCISEHVLNIRGVDGLTLRNTMIVDSHDSTPDAGDYGGLWPAANIASAGRESATFFDYASNMLAYGCFIDWNGWQPGSDFLRSVAYAHPMEQYSHGFYLQGKASHSCDYVGIIYSLFSRNAYVGAQPRTGATLEGCVFAENNVAHNIGNKTDEGGSYSASIRTVVVGGGYHCTDKGFNNDENPVYYKMSRTIDNANPTAAIKDCLFLNGIDPDNPNEPPHGSIYNLPSNRNTKAKIQARGGSGVRDSVSWDVEPYYQNYTTHNWPGASNEGPVNSAVAAQRTIARWGAQRFGGSPTLDETLDAVRAAFRARTFNIPEEVRAMNDWFHDAVDRDLPTPVDGATVKAVAPLTCDGMRNDIEDNWDAGYVPGLGQSNDIDTNGLDRTHAQHHTVHPHLYLRGAEYTIYGGVMEVGTVHDGSIVIAAGRAGQFWLDGGVTGSVNVSVEGGRFLNSGALSGDLDLTATAEEVVFAWADGSVASWTISSGSTVTLSGGVLAGFDGSGGAAASLTIAAGGTLVMDAAGGTLPQIREFRTGINGETAPNVASAVTCGGTIEVDVTGISAGTYDLIIADTITGTFATETITGGSGSIGYTATKVQVTVT